MHPIHLLACAYMAMPPVMLCELEADACAAWPWLLWSCCMANLLIKAGRCYQEQLSIADSGGRTGRSSSLPLVCSSACRCRADSLAKYEPVWHHAEFRMPTAPDGPCCQHAATTRASCGRSVPRRCPTRATWGFPTSALSATPTTRTATRSSRRTRRPCAPKAAAMAGRRRPQQHRWQLHLQFTSRSTHSTCSISSRAAAACLGTALAAAV